MDAAPHSEDMILCFVLYFDMAVDCGRWEDLVNWLISRSRMQFSKGS